MPGRKNTLKLQHEGLAINADVRTEKLTPEKVEKRPEVVRRDAESGELVVRQVYDKESGDALENGYGYRWVNESGEEVARDEIEYYEVHEDGEKKVSKHEATIGGERTLTPIHWLSIDQVTEFLVDRTYEMWGETEEDENQLAQLADHIRDYGVAPVIPVVLRKSLYQSWGIITPRYREDEFSLIVRITQQKIEPQNFMPLREDVDVAKPEEERPAATQRSPFSEPESAES